MIGGAIFKLVFPEHSEVSLCPTAFHSIIGISGYKLYQAAVFVNNGKEVMDDLPEYLSQQKIVHAPKRVQIQAFLQHVYDNLSTSVDPSNPNEKRRYALGTSIDDKLFFFFHAESLGYLKRSALFDDFEMCNDNDPTCYTWFVSTWLKYYPLLICWHDRGCSDCDALMLRLNLAKKSHDIASARSVVEDYDTHRRLCNAIHQEIELKLAQSSLFNSNSEILWSDHWGIHYFVAEKRSLAEFKLISSSGVLGVNFSALWNGTEKTGQYILYTEPFGEDSNIICNHLWDYIIDIAERKHHVKVLVIASDSHSTQRNNLVFKMCDYLIRVLKVFGENGQLFLYYYHPGHHDHAGDRAHSKCQQAWTTYLRQGKRICDPICVCNDVMGHLAPTYSFTWKMGFFDFKSWFATASTIEVPAISSVHVAHFSELGMSYFSLLPLCLSSFVRCSYQIFGYFARMGSVANECKY